jgi:O-acetyl-ADP-ribose deacetylase (regulator of RNase III)
MNKLEKKQRLIGRQMEGDLDDVLRRKVLLVPTTPDQVEAAEHVLEQEDVELPSSLSGPKALRRKLVKPQAGVVQPTPAALDGYWTHASVISLAGNQDPVKVITQRAREVVLEALEGGWSGPPYDPFALADLLNIRLIPSQEVVDARLTANATGAFKLEFNPSRPRARMRYSIAHEIAHTLLPDCARAVRHRGPHEDMAPDNWQLETLCNIAASEILMPIGSLSEEDTTQVSVDAVAALRKKFQVSSEAALLRLTRLTDVPCLAFAAHRDEIRGRYFIDYSVASRAWRCHIRPGFPLPKNAKAFECTAIGYTTAKVAERWSASVGEWCVEYLGIPPYPGQVFPRVLGIASLLSEQSSEQSKITFVKGSALEPRGAGNRIIVQLVNDKALTWGAGFAKNLRRKWPELQTKFTQWIEERRSEFRLGAVHLTEIEPSLYLASLVAQHGYGLSPKPRIRYRALTEALGKVSKFALERNASVHMPRIGSGQSGGRWDIVSEIVDEVLCQQGIAVTVYDLPGVEPAAPKQPSLFF